MSDKGKVYLVGAGPGDPGLLTRKAERLIKEADAILYDVPPGEGLEELFPPGVKLVDIGRHSPDEVNGMLVGLASGHTHIVRLFRGDPYVFGRGGEQADALRKAGIEVEVVPGIAPAIAAPAHAGIPVTHRGFASAVTLLEGDEGPIHYKALAQLEGTIVLNGTSRLREAVEALLEGGKPRDTPVAIIERGATPGERVTAGNLGNIVGLAELREVEAFAIVVIGEVVRLRGVLK